MSEFAGRKMRTVIVEDNVDSLNKLKGMLADYDNIELVGDAQNVKDAVRMIERRKPDLLFLDIIMPGGDGFDVLEKINHQPMVIFISAYNQYAVKAFEVNGIDYILKPFSKERLRHGIERVVKLEKKLSPEILEVLKFIEKKRKRDIVFSVKENDQIILIPRDDVYYFKAEDKYVFLYTEDKRYFYNSTLKELESRLDPEIFCRIDRGCIVSLLKIKKLKKGLIHEYKVVLDDARNTSIKISGTHLPELKKRLNIKIKI